ncbi:HNH endonuclease family protein [Albimonas sp. CAU 1670]|uniref:HNH endonuclease family protein n=1 Tax=Albimonas sp. CAU 1670 TaxID=3032599 RepID=UPI0023DBD7CD|nr:HNH endonuclease family protein [Albimonas sp. CAU 1670]MDF2233168.1 HNH endonuclease family protein [Albimonas sp. CAU 1670]
MGLHPTQEWEPPADPERFTWAANGCRVLHGRWFDPYTNRIYTEARDLDIDHLVPLAYAWSRGAADWSAEKRTAFANDPANLFAVQASANRQKGAAGPVEWMPPHEGFHCQYLLRFVRIAKSYGLTIPSSEMKVIDIMMQNNCGD